MLRQTKTSRQRRPISATGPVETLEGRTFFNATYHPLASGALSQNWNDTGLITTNDNWANVPSIIGYRGDGITGSTGANPQGLLADGTGTPVSVIANAPLSNLTNSSASGGVYEFDSLANPTIALNGSGTADAPFILLHLNSTGVPSVDVSYLLRDIEATDNTNQQYALHYRIGNTGTWTDVPAAYIADATTAAATAMTPVAATLPPDAGNQPQLQVRIMTSNAASNDESVGIDDIVIQATPVVNPPGTFAVSPIDYNVSESVGSAMVRIGRTSGSGGQVTVDYTTGDTTSTDNIAAAGTDYDVTAGTVTFADGETEKFIPLPITNDAGDELAESFSFTISNVSGGASLGATEATVNIFDNDGHVLSAGDFEQNWSDANLIFQSGDYSDVPNIVGYQSDAEAAVLQPNVLANQSNPNGVSIGGTTEFDAISDPTVALQATGTAAFEPQLVLDLDTRDATAVSINYNLRDLDSTVDDAFQTVRLEYRIGEAGAWTTISFVEDATEAVTATLVTPVSEMLPPDALGLPLVQLRIVSNNAPGNDEWVGVDDIVISAQPDVPSLPAWLHPDGDASWDTNTDTLTVTGTATIIDDPALFPLDDHPTIIVSASGALIVNSTPLIVNIGSLTVATGGTATLAAMPSGGTDRVLVIEGALDVDGKLDVTNNSLVLKNAVLGDVAASIANSATLDLNWIGNGITSTSAANDSSGITGIGYASVLDYAGGGSLEFEGVSLAGLDDDDVLVKYTYYGDADLSGQADVDDFPLYIFGLEDPEAPQTWYYGDFNYSGEVDVDDFPLYIAGLEGGGAAE